MLNKNYEKIAASYLFSTIAKKVNAFVESTGKDIIKLGIGDTTEPLTPSVVTAMKKAVEEMGNVETYSGYGDEQGFTPLRDAIAKVKYQDRGLKIDSGEVFVSDGAKPDSANIQELFDTNCKIAVQDPAYPVYVDSNVLAGRTGTQKDGKYEGIVYLENDENFIPKVPSEKVDLIYLCFPNNPTGATVTKEQLKPFVDYCKENGAVLIYDPAYSVFVQDDSMVRSIYEVEGADEVAIEICSFSKEAGFTGIRCGWTVVPKALGRNLHAMWNRRQCTKFNGACHIAQKGALAVLSEQGQAETKELISYYMENAKLIKECFDGLGMKNMGGSNAPYVWIKTPGDMGSWEFFDKLLAEAAVVCTPGAGFGPAGEGYIRISAFCHRENCIRAIDRIKQVQF